jgi:hypothetical protein
MSKHTPAPWEVVRGQIHGPACTNGLGVPILCDLHSWSQDAPQEGEANARLIAAAPELLAALNELIEAADSMRATFGRIRGNTPEDSDTFIHEKWAEGFLQERADAARAAIAKATGEQA